MAVPPDTHRALHTGRLPTEWRRLHALRCAPSQLNGDTEVRTRRSALVNNEMHTKGLNADAILATLAIDDGVAKLGAELYGLHRAAPKRYWKLGAQALKEPTRLAGQRDLISKGNAEGLVNAIGQGGCSETSRSSTIAS